jgi:hypothetical protein
MRLTTGDTLFPERQNLGGDPTQLHSFAFVVVCDGTDHLSERRESVFGIIKQHGVLGIVFGVYSLVGGEECDWGLSLFRIPN